MVDFEELNLDHIERFNLPEDEKQHLMNMVLLGQTHVVVLSGEDIIFSIGYQRVNYDVAMIYVATDRVNLKKYKKSFHRAIRLMEKDFKERMGIRKLLATTTPDCHTSMKWLRAIGFEIEGVIKSFTDGEDHVLFGRVS